MRHLDVWPANLIDGNGTSVLLGWAFMGEGGSARTSPTSSWTASPTASWMYRCCRNSRESATGRYLEGLRDGGWSGSDDAVRAAIAACGAAKYSWLGPGG